MNWKKMQGWEVEEGQLVGWKKYVERENRQSSENREEMKFLSGGGGL